METMIGFIAGYLAGTKDGPGGLARIRKSLEAIRTSPELRRLAGEAAGIGGIVVKQAGRRGLAGVVGEVTSRLAGNEDSDTHGRRR
jgi:hypothetical protein